MFRWEGVLPTGRGDVGFHYLGPPPNSFYLYACAGPYFVEKLKNVLAPILEAGGAWFINNSPLSYSVRVDIPGRSLGEAGQVLGNIHRCFCESCSWIPWRH